MLSSRQGWCNLSEYRGATNPTTLEERQHNIQYILLISHGRRFSALSNCNIFYVDFKAFTQLVPLRCPADHAKVSKNKVSLEFSRVCVPYVVTLLNGGTKAEPGKIGGAQPPSGINSRKLCQNDYIFSFSFCNCNAKFFGTRNTLLERCCQDLSNRILQAPNS